VATGSDGTITSGGVLSSASATFDTDNVVPGDWVLIYHNKESVTGTWVESTGLFQIASVDSETQLTLTGFTGRAWVTAELPYFVIRPITYTTYGAVEDGDATISGSNSLPTVIDMGSRTRLRFDGLKIINTTDTLATDGVSTARSSAAIKGTSAGAAHIHICNCTFDNTLNAGIYSINCNYAVLSHNTITNFNGWGLALLGIGSIQEHNTITGKGTTLSVRSGLAGNFGSIIRYNTVTDVVGSWGDAHADSIGYIDGGSGSNDYGHIYGNTVDNFTEALALYGTGGGTLGWLIHSNLFLCRYVTGVNEKGDCAILLMGADGTCIFNNTFVGAVDGVLGRIAANAIRLEHRADPIPHCTNVQIKNNLFIADSGTSISIQADMETGIEIDTNHHYFTGVTTIAWWLGVSKTISTWRAAGQDLNGFDSSSLDPEISDLATEDFSLEASSPDISAGEDLSAYFTRDINGDTRQNWSIGAYEYGDPEPPATGGVLVLGLGSGNLVLGVEA
jgi:hypothetical protein